MAEINKDLSTAKIVAVSYDKRNKKSYKYLTNLDVSLGDVVKTPTGSAVVVAMDAKKYGNYELDWLEGIILHNEGEYASSLDLFKITEENGKVKMKMAGNALKYGDIVIPKCDGKPIILLSGGFKRKIRKLTIPENVELIEEDAFGCGYGTQFIINCSRSFDVIQDSALRMYVIYEDIKALKPKDEIPQEYLKFMSENLAFVSDYFRLKRIKDVFFSPAVINSNALSDQAYLNLNLYEEVFNYIFNHFDIYKEDQEFMSKLYEFISDENETRSLGFNYKYAYYYDENLNVFSYFIQYLNNFPNDNLKEVLSNPNVRYTELTEGEIKYIFRSGEQLIGSKYELMCRDSIKKSYYYDWDEKYQSYITCLKTKKLI